MPTFPHPLSPRECAPILGVTARVLELWIAGKRGPPVPHELYAGQKCLWPHAAYAHLLAHGSARLTAKLKKPPGDESPAAAVQTSAGPTFDGKPHEFLERLLKDPAFAEQYGAEKINTFIRAAAELRAHQSEAHSQAALLDPADVLKMLRSYGRVLVEEVEDISSRRLAAHLVGVLRGQFAVDLPALNPAAEALLEREIRADHNLTLDAVRKRIDDDCAGVQLLEGTA